MKNNIANTIGFIGLGLIGGSIAKAVRRVYPDTTIIGYDTDTEALHNALLDGTLSVIAKEIDSHFKDCDYIFLCAPVSYNISYLSELKSIMKPDCILTDVGSVKGPIHKAAKELHMEDVFIGGHPMVGSEKAGYSHCHDRLIENAYYFITPSDGCPPEKVVAFTSFIEELGALSILLDPEKHDYITASISHVPHIVAALLVHMVKNADDQNGILKQLAAGGFKDITRIASSSATVWEQITFSNLSNIKKLLLDSVDSIQNIIAALDQNDTSFIYDYFDEARQYRDSVPDNAIGLMQKTYEIFVDIPDSPGTLAGTTTLLALNQISIKNIGIIHNREYEEGVLKIVFYDRESTIKAYEVLTERNYPVHIRN